MNLFLRLFPRTQPRKLKLRPPYYFPANFGQPFDVTCSYCTVTTSFNMYMRVRINDFHQDSPQFQCQQCGQLRRLLYIKGMDLDNPGTACNCGGRLSRMQVLVCPNCKNTKT